MRTRLRFETSTNVSDDSGGVTKTFGDSTIETGIVEVWGSVQPKRGRRVGDLDQLQSGDFVIDARGRTYFSNQSTLLRLRAASKPAFNISVGQVPAADVYVLDQTSLGALSGK